ncbi:MAG: DNA mismatch repair endonuclease MutL [Clostridia bacterium]|nr:DNA mismatch repair endonuclease MutL [Clostridia bacterium]
MGKINVLDQQIANLIAAGEVVDRPASVVKEMLENSIDAGAKNITLEIKRGGVSFIRVSDDGCGMSREDVPVSIKRHATSKIKSAADLDGIMTLGFRGEALAAIGSVSKLRIMTKPHGDTMGTLLQATAGDVELFTETGCVDGTTIIVEDLFANVPARRKFLKKDASEALAVTAVIEKIALSRPDLAFRFISDGALKFATNGDGDLKNCIYAVLGRDFAHRLTAVDDMTDGIGIKGFIGSPENIRANRNYQNFFINGRYVKSRTAMAALEQAFSSYIPGDKFPVCVLFITLHPAYVDVNVHPAKLEVKFSNEQIVFNAVYSSVRGALVSKLDRPDTLLKTKEDFRRETRALNGFVPIPDGTGSKKEQMKLKYEDGPVPAGGYSVSPSPLQPPASDDGEFSIPKLDSRPKPEDDVVRPVQAPSVPLPLSMDPQANCDITTSAVDMQSEDSDDDPLSRFMQTGTKNGRNPKGVQPPQTPRPTSQATTNINKSDFSSAETTQNTSDAFFPREYKSTAESKKTSPESNPIKTNTPSAEHSSTDNETAGQHRSVSSLNRTSAEEVEAPPYKMIGEAFNSYIMVETDGKLLLIDKHAAHERILFEDMKKNLRGQSTSQMLFIPLEISLSPTELAAAEEYREEIEAVGYGYTISEERKMAIVDQIPALLENDAAEAMLVTVTGKLANGTGDVATTRDTFFEQALYQASCKAAIKAGRIYDASHLKWICDRVLSNPEIRFCPHGRPVAFEMTQSEIERSFKRT